MRHLRLSASAGIPEQARSLEMLEVLDTGDGTPYSCLVYFLTAALQALFAVCRQHARNRVVRPSVTSDLFPAVDLRPLQPLSGSAPEGLLPVDLTGSLLFRGLWVPEHIDEEAARLQWSFNSFSRYLCGALHVLNFYASSHARVSSIARSHRHVLLLVMRRFAQMRMPVFQTQDWAFPVQFFNGFNGRVEHEFVLPPFVEYTFEEDLEICSCMPGHEQEHRFAEISKRWQLRRPVMEEVPELRDLLCCTTVPLRNPHVEVRASGSHAPYLCRFNKCVPNQGADGILEQEQHAGRGRWDEILDSRSPGFRHATKTMQRVQKERSVWVQL